MIRAEYEAHKILASEDLSKGMIETIQVDINRSFKAMKDGHIQPDNLVNILHANAVVNLEMEYCQGMNFIAGFLYLMTQSEEASFAIMKQII